MLYVKWFFKLLGHALLFPVYYALAGEKIQAYSISKEKGYRCEVKNTSLTGSYTLVHHRSEAPRREFLTPREFFANLAPYPWSRS